ncbi:hypothetical protein GCM10022289_24000 [Pedobacter jeongneungensis]|uniref:Uncharacterized protein n=1 Tax=Pedobacter jeongneungensis TaxID=947309 RepID=A0ABP8BEK7_9SPHI
MRRITPTIIEQKREIRNDVLKIFFNSSSSLLNSAVYFTTPDVIAPFAKDNTTDIKLANAPINATPAGPVKIAIALLATNPELILINVTIAEKRLVFINFTIIR